MGACTIYGKPICSLVVSSRAKADSQPLSLIFLQTALATNLYRFIAVQTSLDCSSSGVCITLTNWQKYGEFKQSLINSYVV